MGSCSVAEVPCHGSLPRNNNVGGTVPGKTYKTMHMLGHAVEYTGMAVGTHQTIQATRPIWEPIIAGARAAMMLL